jgi:hypothetical protein
MKFIILITTILIAVSLSFCQSKIPEQKIINDSITSSIDTTKLSTNIAENGKENFLIIHGKDIWVRDLPSTGKVVLKLNEGDKCKILEKGKMEILKGRPDYWYKIEFNKLEGWVFGSQTDNSLFKPLDQPFTGNLSAVCDDLLIQEIGTPSSFSYLFKNDNTFRFTVAAGYTIEGKTEWKSNILILILEKLIMDSPEGSKNTEIQGKITFSVYKKDQIVCLAEKENNLKDKTYSPTGGCFCMDQ